MTRRRASTRAESASAGPANPLGAGADGGSGTHNLRSWLVALVGLAGLTLAMFGSVLFSSGGNVLSNGNRDLFRQFVHWRGFGFGELRHGNLALWNPHLFSGTPYFGGFQSALLYPPNFLFLVLPLGAAINWSIAVHVFLAGAFTYAWAAHRKLHPLACFLSAVIFMFCGAHFTHVYAGHLPNLCALVWAPLLFLAMDGLFEKPSVGWSLLGMFSAAMQVLAGHPQYTFYTGVAAGVYGVLCCFKAQDRKRFLLGLAGVVVGAVGLSAVQLLTGIEESREMMRSAGVGYDFAAMFSFPPENFLTLLAPNFFGDLKGPSYWGRCYLWEMSLFLSVTGLVLATVGAIWGGGQRRRFAVVMVLVLCVLALGAHTPLFKLLYYAMPGFDKFRGSSKFIFLASLFVALLAGIGLDLLLAGRRLPRAFGIAAAAAAVLLAVGAIWLHQCGIGTVAPDTAWQKIMLAVRDTHEGFLPAPPYSDAAFVSQAAARASAGMFLAAGTLGVVAGLLVAASRWRQATWVLVPLAAGELFWFAHGLVDSFPLKDALDLTMQRKLAARPGDYRILNLARSPNSALSTGANDLWGYDPGVLRRYAELMALTQDLDPNAASQYLLFRHDHPLYAMLRLRLTLVPEDAGVMEYEATNGMARVQLISRYRVIPQRDAIFAALANAAFNPREEVILETPPQPVPQPASDPGTVVLLDSSTDHLTIEAMVKSPCLLLITDTYAKGWRARALPGSVQAAYEVLPANYCLRAVPLAAGHHRLRVEYSPRGFQVGIWISALSLLAGCGLAGCGLAGWCVWPGRTRTSARDGGRPREP